MIGYRQITGVMLVGGKSRRMGTDKALLEIGGMPLYGRLLRILHENFPSVILVGDNHERFREKQLLGYDDIYPGSTLGGVYTGIVKAQTDAVFVTACDIPFPSSVLIRYLCRQLKENDAVVPLTANGIEPLFACYRKSCLPVMQRQIEKGRFKIRDCYPELAVNYVKAEVTARFDAAGTALLNINTPADYHSCLSQH
jgi:molybdopterin-guanine dinucleotide biosynthesis protein A